MRSMASRFPFTVMGCRSATGSTYGIIAAASSAYWRRDGETYNLGGNAERQNLDVVKSICAHLNKILGADEKIRERFPKCPAALGGDTGELIKFVKDRPGHDRRYAIDAMKATLETG